MDCGNWSRVWLCRCDCGRLCNVRQGNLIYKIVQSCGCLRGKNFLNNDNYGTGKNNTSGITGVCPGPNGMWIAQIGYNGKIYNIGSFKTKEQAADARYLAEQKCKADFLKQRVDFEEEPQRFDCQFKVTPLQAQWLHEHFGGNAEICTAVRSLMIQNSRRVVYVPQPKPSERTIMFTLSLYNGERELLDNPAHAQADANNHGNHVFGQKRNIHFAFSLSNSGKNCYCIGLKLLFTSKNGLFLDVFYFLGAFACFFKVCNSVVCNLDLFF